MVLIYCIHRARHTPPERVIWYSYTEQINQPHLLNWITVLLDRCTLGVRQLVLYCTALIILKQMIDWLID